MEQPVLTTKKNISTNWQGIEKETMEKLKKQYLFFIFILFLIFLFVLSKKGSGIDFPDYGVLHKFDPHREGGHLLPNLDLLVQSEKVGSGVRFMTNSMGFRNEREFDYEVHEKGFRILFLGDSFVDGMRTDQKKTIGYVLENTLNAKIKKIRDSTYDFFEVMISGHNNPANAWYYYQEHGQKYHPNLVILGVTLGNDITWHNYKSGVMPIASSNGSIRLNLTPNASQVGTYKPDLMLPIEAYKTVRHIYKKLQDLELRMRRSLAKNSYLFAYDVPPLLGPKKNIRYYVYAAGFFNSLGLFYRPAMPEIEKMYLDFEEVLSGLHSQVKDNGGELLVILFPTRIQVSKKDWKLLTRFYSLDRAKFDLDYPNNRIGIFCKEHNINCLDLLLPFRQCLEKSNEHLYRSMGDMHFNEEGQELAAKKIAEWVLRYGLVKH